MESQQLHLHQHHRSVNGKTSLYLNDKVRLSDIRILRVSYSDELQCEEAFLHYGWSGLRPSLVHDDDWSNIEEKLYLHHPFRDNNDKLYLPIKWLFLMNFIREKHTFLSWEDVGAPIWIKCSIISFLFCFTANANGERPFKISR